MPKTAEHPGPDLAGAPAPHPLTPGASEHERGIYLDHNATTRPSPGVVAAVERATRELWANPSSVHRAGQAVRHAIELARQDLADLIGARARQVTFTGSGTEAIDLAIRGVLGAAPPERRALITSRVEHAAVRELGETLEKSGTARVRWLAVDRAGLIDLDDLADALRQAPPGALVSVQWANNETGGVQPVHEVAALCRAGGALFHCDATQWVGKRPTRVLDETPRAAGRLGGPPPTPAIAPGATPPPPASVAPHAAPGEPALAADLLTLAPHKFNGPKGVGVLWARRGLGLRPMILGSQELGRRGGTENVAGIVGAGVAAREAIAWLGDPSARARVAGLRDAFERRLQELIPDAVVHGPVDPPGTPEPRQRRLWNTTKIAFPRLEAEALLLALSERGVYASAGSACSSGSLEPSAVLTAMGVPPELAHGSLRFSLCKDTTADELDRAAPLVADAVAQLRRSSLGVL